MKVLTHIWREVKKQLMNVPSFGVSNYEVPKTAHLVLDCINAQIDKSIEENPKRIIFLLGPFGSGKTTQVQSFLKTHPAIRYKYFSAVKINSLDFAYLNLTNYGSRLAIILLCMLSAIYCFSCIPLLAALPILVIFASIFTKSFGNLLYIVHEVIDSLFQKRPKLVVIEDLERSSLSKADQWALLANLWQYKRSYIVTLGYAPEEKQARLQLIEYAIKLGGTIIEIPLSEEANFSMMKQVDPDFPFSFAKKDFTENRGWLSFFTFREILVIREQVILKLQLDVHSTDEKLRTIDRQMKYIQFCLELLLEKLGLAHREFVFIEHTREIKGLTEKNIPEEQAHFLKSFIDSIRQDLGVKLVG